MENMVNNQLLEFQDISGMNSGGKFDRLAGKTSLMQLAQTY